MPHVLTRKQIEALATGLAEVEISSEGDNGRFNHAEVVEIISQTLEAIRQEVVKCPLLTKDQLDCIVQDALDDRSAEERKIIAQPIAGAMDGLFARAVVQPAGNINLQLN